ncbi:DUF397 domain-containing protein [Actinocorallia libanotica]|uniref:DUF397 domain-containing protein n=1 Tax=Actinocorallia libanotica TaxID=46162 RepID=A0ABN1RHM6_9ACTN
MSGWEQIRWRKSSHSDHQGGNCVELGRLDAAVAVRDSKNPNTPHLTFDRAAFRALTRKIRSEAGLRP